MHMHALKREHVDAHTNTKNDVSVSASECRENSSTSAVISDLGSITAKPNLN